MAKKRPWCKAKVAAAVGTVATAAVWAAATQYSNSVRGLNLSSLSQSTHAVSK